MSIKKTIRLGLVFLLLPQFLILAAGYATEGSEVAEIKTRVANIEKQQQAIIAKDEEILQKLDQLRIWVHRK